MNFSVYWSFPFVSPPFSVWLTSSLCYNITLQSALFLLCTNTFSFCKFALFSLRSYTLYLSLNNNTLYTSPQQHTSLQHTVYTLYTHHQSTCWDIIIFHQPMSNHFYSYYYFISTLYTSYFILGGLWLKRFYSLS